MDWWWGEYPYSTRTTILTLRLSCASTLWSTAAAAEAIWANRELGSKDGIGQCNYIWRSRDWNTKWKILPRRWFVFDRNKRTLVYYADKSEVSNPSKQNLHLLSKEPHRADVFSICSHSYSQPGEGEGGHLLPLDLGGVRRPPEDPGRQPEGHLHHENKWQVYTQYKIQQ